MSRGEAPVSLAPRAAEVGLAVMMADLIRQNLARDEAKWRDFEKLDAPIALEARDAGVAATLVFRRGSLVVHGGIHGTPAILISADSEPLIRLATIVISAGIPNLFTPAGRAFLAGLLSRRIRVAGMLAHPVMLIRLTRLISVY